MRMKTRKQYDTGLYKKKRIFAQTILSNLHSPNASKIPYLEWLAQCLDCYFGVSVSDCSAIWEILVPGKRCLPPSTLCSVFLAFLLRGMLLMLRQLPDLRFSFRAASSTFSALRLLGLPDPAHARPCWPDAELRT